MLFKLFLLFTLVPIVELYVLIEVGSKIGALNTVLIILVTAITGAYMARTQGVQVIYQIQEALNAGRIPGRELLHGLFILLGGATLLTPGFITDVIGFTMLLPLTRKLYIRVTLRWIRRKLETGEWRVEE
ncbi:MAG: membrane protein FxsA [Calditrichaeota bacterium]|nr:MAG: membrane protein FxsA [Calditrichota bacterium]